MLNPEPFKLYWCARPDLNLRPPDSQEAEVTPISDLQKNSNQVPVEICHRAQPASLTRTVNRAIVDMEKQVSIKGKGGDINEFRISKSIYRKS